MASYRILYAGDDTVLPERLNNVLHDFDCFVMYSPVGIARIFIQSEIKYSLLLFDETEAGAELGAYARLLPHRERVPVMVVKKSKGLGALLGTIKRRLKGRVP